MKKIMYALSALAFIAAIAINAQTTRAQSTMPVPSVSQSSMSSEPMNKSDVLVQMIALHVQNTDLLAEEMRNQYSESPTTDASKQALQANGQQISDLVGSQFGSQTQDVFNSYWTETMNQFIMYTQGLKENDETMQNEALVGIHRNILQASEMIAEETNLPRQAVDDVLRQHVNMMRGVIESYANEDYSQSYTYQMRAQKQIAMIAQTVTDALLP